MTGIGQKWLDEFLSHFHTMPGELRKIRSDTRKVLADKRKEKEDLKRFVESIKAQRSDELADSLANNTKGYVILLREEMKANFDELHRIVEEYKKVEDRIIDIQGEIRDRAQMDPQLRKKLLSSITAYYYELQKAFGSLLASIAGIESFSLSSKVQQMLQVDTQIQVERGEVVKARGKLKDLQRVISQSRKTVQSLEKHMPSSDEIKLLAKEFSVNGTDGSPDAKYNLQANLLNFLDELTTIASMIIALINQTHQELVQFKSKGPDFRQRVPLERLSENVAPTWGLLVTPYAKGGYGFPTNGPQYAKVAHALEETEQVYKGKLKDLLMESRLFQSDLEHQKDTNAAPQRIAP